MTERLISPYRRAGKLLGLVRELSSFCEQHQHRDLAGGMSFDELFEVERQLTDALRWVQQLGARGVPKARAAEQLITIEDEVF
ncbi:hypothetical protein IVB14_23285 [Bradyrhizobium sp. 180]|uniref:hypothetical protein n=1 Tax=unclassified Bradyrhizobium TaxID=2631580 RepID=UPI001FFAF37C|nr:MULTISPECIES: hypothetical protein [unclassified Bradyrhizobium]MCK1493274.1 hypothetical protein [Bradyrhizobium sp. 180]MCK1529002.1 hypothetical protein [Bradyrhizobium sp. 182]MCK1595865.1 hypothetical protein [Bradyrhizobium sp. 164]